eukprot:snap_masked-scaffold_1-processed-gene-5.19-mRNA-1 protein AED:0.33 eAED:0.33 QI:0/-1/0/1/-1/1/1/0/116
MDMLNGKLVGVIGDEDTVTGFLLAGIGERSGYGSNFLSVTPQTKITEVEKKFEELTTRKDIGIILINQHVANMIRPAIQDYNGLIPTVLEIPSKEHPYDAAKDEVMKQVNLLLGIE